MLRIVVIMLRIGWLTAGVFMASAFALDPHKAITQFVHTAWTGKDGAPSNIQALAQTNDGYLWLGTTSGLFRFDGVRFSRVELPPGENSLDLSIKVLLATRDGALWIVPRSAHISRFFNGHLKSYAESDGLPRTLGLTEAPDGSLIAATEKGLRRFNGGIWTDAGKESNLPGGRAQQAYFDRAGTLWVITGGRIFYRRAGQNQFVDSGERTFNFVTAFQFAEGPDSAIWLADLGESARKLSKDRKFSEVPAKGACNILVDRNGSLWIGTTGAGLRRVAFLDSLRRPEVEQFTTREGFSADWTASVLEDREGNIWWGTDHGLDRFSDGAVTPVSIPEGERPRSIIASRDGSLWTSALARHGVWHMGADGTGELVDAGIRAPISMFEDEKGVLWLGSLGLMRRERGRFVNVPLPNGFVAHNVWSITKDHSGALWLLDQSEGLLRFSDGVITNLSSAAGIGAAAGILYTDHLGRVWIGVTDRIALYQDGKFRTFGAGDGLPPGGFLAFAEDRAGNFWAGGNGGLSMFKNGRFQTLSRPNGFPARSAFGIAEGADGDWWIPTDTGVLRIKPTELQTAAGDPNYRVRFQLFNILDGLPGNPRQNYPLPLICRATDGRIWIAAINGIAFVDPNQIPKNAVLPPVHVEAVRVNGKPIAPADGIALAPETDEVEIDYTALSLSIPERVLFRYKLEGAETDWHDAGTRRQAFYNHLGPKQYRFRVMACNNDGVWNEAGATWTFRIMPAFYQTLWFYLACVGLVVFALWGLYQLRVRQLAAGMNARFDERMAERNRLATELHDTILQSVQATKMIADNARYDHADDPARQREAIESISDWLAHAATEARAALNALHISTTQKNDLAKAFQRAAEVSGATSSMKLILSVEGAAQDMHPIVRDEVYRIGCEAIRNACLHSGATELEVSLSYAQDLTVHVRDNGRGIDPNVAIAGKPGHFGLRGMQERATRIRGRLRLLSRPGSGTDVELFVPGKVVFSLGNQSRRASFTMRPRSLNWKVSKEEPDDRTDPRSQRR